jgi:sulfate/thiosulfate transport system ATP-binding protein
MSIKVEHISKSFGTFKALDDVSLTIPTNKLVALLGPSGSGKTTLLRIIAGLEIPDEGNGAIFFNEEDVVNRQVTDRQVGFVFQHYALFRHMSVYENIAFGLKVKPKNIRPSKKEINQRVDELLNLIQLEGLAGRYPNQLSGGQRQRVALARALAVQPKVLLLDEPFGALDAQVRLELRRWLRRLHEEINVTSVFVTHDQEEALEVADFVVVMNHGKIEQIGTPEDVFHRPETEFVMNFIGQVNQFHGRVEHGKGLFGKLVINDDQINGADNTNARLFVRPHEIRVTSKPTGNQEVPVRIVHIHLAGPRVRLELEDDENKILQVDMSHDDFMKTQLKKNDKAFVSLQKSRIFISDED